ncbi:MAG: hypothetical protein HOW73_42040 [Polyangiaceae bacterium]|nr:hypothetical protein [Polyangiaceae bacterium]
MRHLLAFTSLLFAVGCASGPVDLAGAKVLDVRVFAYSNRPGPVSESNLELSKEEKMPCEASEMRVAVEVRAIRAGGSAAEVFSSGGGLADRIKANPAAYKDFAIEDARGYEASHTFDLREVDFTVGDSIQMERIGTKTTTSMSGASEGERLDLEEVLFRLDQKKGATSGFELVAIPKFAPDKKVTRTWAANRGCEKKTVIAAAAGDLNHRNGDPGPRVTVYVTKAKSEAGEVVLAFAEHAKGNKWVVLDLGTPHTFVAAGGDGVSGTSVEPGGDGGQGGTIQILVDKRFPDLQSNLQFEAPGGRGGRGSQDGKDGAPGEGAVKTSDDVIKVLAKRGDLPSGLSLIDPPPPEEPKSKGPKPKEPKPKAPTPQKK